MHASDILHTLQIPYAPHPPIGPQLRSHPADPKNHTDPINAQHLCFSCFLKILSTLCCITILTILSFRCFLKILSI